MKSPLLTVTLGFIAEDKTALDKSPISVLEDVFCTHTTGVDGVTYNDRTDLGGDVGHISYYCERCGKLMRKEY